METLNEWKLKAETELEERYMAEERFQNLKKLTDELLIKNSSLEQEINQWKVETQCLEANATRCYHTVMEAVSQLLVTNVNGVLES